MCDMSHVLSLQIWANVQQYDKPSQMRYKLDDTACWESVFNRSYPTPGLGSIQVNTQSHKLLPSRGII